MRPGEWDTYNSLGFSDTNGSDRQPDLVIVHNKKRTCRIVVFTVLADHWVNLKESEKTIDTYILLENWKNQKKKKTNNNKGLVSLRNKKTSGDHPRYSIIKIGQNTEKSAADSRILALTLTPVQVNKLTLVGKTPGSKIIFSQPNVLESQMLCQLPFTALILISRLGL